jgi:hypothetical protein
MQCNELNRNLNRNIYIHLLYEVIIPFFWKTFKYGAHVIILGNYSTFWKTFKYNAYVRRLANLQ